MRVIQQMVTNDIVANLSTTYQRIAMLSGRLASGKQLRQPSDDPGGVSYAINLQASISLNQQFQDTSNTAHGYLQSTGSALQQITAVIQRARQLAVQGSSDSNAQADRQAMASEIQQLIQQVQQVGNTTFGNTAIFSGTMTQTTAFNALGGFSGNNSARQLEIATGFTMAVNVNAGQMFTGTGGVFNVLKNLNDHLAATGQPIAAKNQGTATMAASGIYSGATQGYLVQVTGTGTNGVISGASYSTDGGVTWTAATAAAAPQTFTLNNGLTVNFTNAAVTANAAAPPALGDRYGFAAVAGGNASGFAIQSTTNVGNETLGITGTYSGTGSPAFQIRASQLDANKNVVGVQLSVDNGTTWQPTIATTTGSYNPPTVPTAGPTLTATQFTLGNGLTLTWNQSTINASQVYATATPNQDVFAFSQQSVDIGEDIGALDTLSNTVSGLQAQFGAKEKTVQDNVSQLQQQSLQLQRVLSQTVDVDFPTATTQMTSAQTLYQAALDVDAKSIQKSLVDFLP